MKCSILSLEVVSRMVETRDNMSTGLKSVWTVNTLTTVKNVCLDQGCSWIKA